MPNDEQRPWAVVVEDSDGNVHIIGNASHRRREEAQAARQAAIQESRGFIEHNLNRITFKNWDSLAVQGDLIHHIRVLLDATAPTPAQEGEKE